MLACCQQCGCQKKGAVARCRECGHDPQSSEIAAARAVYLSTGRFDDPDQVNAYAIELPQIARAIREGRAIDFDEAELERLRLQKHLIESVPASAPWSALLRFFGPGLALLAILWGVVLLLKALK